MMGFTRSYLSQIEAGVKKPGPKFVRRLLEIEGARPYNASLVKEHSVSKPGFINARELGAGVRMIPVISWAQAGIAASFEELPEDWQDFIPAAVSDTKSFGIQLQGDSMEPRYQAGDVAVVLPQSPPRNGDLVIAKIKEEGFAFKILSLVGGDPNRIRLSSYNPAYQPMDFNREQLHWIYPVHSVHKVIRR